MWVTIFWLKAAILFCVPAWVPFTLVCVSCFLLSHGRHFVFVFQSVYLFLLYLCYFILSHGCHFVIVFQPVYLFLLYLCYFILSHGRHFVFVFWPVKWTFLSFVSCFLLPHGRHFVCYRRRACFFKIAFDHNFVLHCSLPHCMLSTIHYDYELYLEFHLTTFCSCVAATTRASISCCSTTCWAGPLGSTFPR